MKAMMLSIALLLVLMPVVAGAAPVPPLDGIWKSEDGTISVIVQKYESGAILLILALENGDIIAFMDHDYTNGITAIDVQQFGYYLNFYMLKPFTQDTPYDIYALIKTELPGIGFIKPMMFLAFPAE